MSGEFVKVGQLEIRYLVDGAQKGGLGVFEMKVPAGAIVPPPHSHTDNEECVYVLEGTLRYSVDGVARLEPGDWMSTPRGSVHHFINPAETARALVIMTPDIGAQYFHDVGERCSRRVDRPIGRNSSRSWPDTGCARDLCGHPLCAECAS